MASIRTRNHDALSILIHFFISKYEMTQEQWLAVPQQSEQFSTEELGDRAPESRRIGSATHR